MRVSPATAIKLYKFVLYLGATSSINYSDKWVSESALRTNSVIGTITTYTLQVLINLRPVFGCMLTMVDACSAHPPYLSALTPLHRRLRLPGRTWVL